MTLLVHTLHVLSLIQHTWLTNTNTGADTGIATGTESYTLSVVSSKKGVLTVCAFLLNDFLLKRAPEGAPFWCDITISCLLLLLQIVFEVCHLRAQNKSTAGYQTDTGGSRWASSHVKESTSPVFFWQKCNVTAWCAHIFLQTSID